MDNHFKIYRIGSSQENSSRVDRGTEIRSTKDKEGSTDRLTILGKTVPLTPDPSLIPNTPVVPSPLPSQVDDLVHPGGREH